MRLLMKILLGVLFFSGISVLILSVLAVWFIYATSGWQYDFLITALWLLGPLILTASISGVAASVLAFLPDFDIRRKRAP